ncbi:MAG TPA: hypothetical protein VMI35_04110, partial [Puia sp.]|nr:hypothetical protein [Puia sp.]
MTSAANHRPPSNGNDHAGPVARNYMKINFRYVFAICMFTALSVQVSGQSDSLRRYRVALFLPLYLDSAFDASGNYRYEKNFPKFINPGLEFYEGAELAIDSLRSEKVPLDIKLYDTRSVTQPVTQVIQSPDFKGTQLIIGFVTPPELYVLANVAAQ